MAKLIFVLLQGLFGMVVAYVILATIYYRGGNKIIANIIKFYKTDKKYTDRLKRIKKDK